MTDYILTQAYGQQGILRECAYSLLTLLKSGYDGRIRIYTDQPEFLKSMLPDTGQIEYSLLEEKKITEYKGEHAFVHRLKICILREFCQEEPAANVLYIDSDTRFRESPQNLFALIADGNLVMHCNEGNIRNQRNHRIFRKLIQALGSSPALNALVGPDTDMWNAGVLGFKSDRKHLLEEVLDLSDRLYASAPLHIMEQLAFSLVFGMASGGNIRSAENEIFHYWYFKEYREVLGDYFHTLTDEKERMDNLERIDPEIMTVPKNSYRESSGVKRIWKKLNGKWKMPAYDLPKKTP